MKYYLELLYYGKEIRSEGLVWIIKGIWKIGENVPMSFMPTFLDLDSIKYLFSLAKFSIELEMSHKRIDDIKASLKEKVNKINMKKINIINTHKEKEKMKFENIENVDMSYNDDDKKIQKEINLNDDKVKDRWSRYIGAMGMEAVRRQANSTILIYGAGGLGVEIAKNLVLSGCKELVLQDNKLTTYYDLSSQFYLNESDIGKNRAESCIKKLQNLNYYVKVSACKDNLPDTLT